MPAERQRVQPRQDTGRRDGDREPVGLVAAGAGARGAYEAGVLSVLLPAIGEELRPTIYVGTSAGAINAALFASLSHLPVEVAVGEALDRWRSINRAMVIKPARLTMPGLFARNVGALLGVTSRPTSLLDTGPLRNSLTKLIDWGQVARNIRSGTVRALAVVTTEFKTGRTKVFYDGPRGGLGNVPKADDDRAVDYVRERVTADHVLASSAIPIAFPPVRLRVGSEVSWHMDGGVRLNAPLKPAITLGAKRLVIVASDPPYYAAASESGDRQPAPPIQDAADHVLRGAMSDRMIEDLISLAHLNYALRSGGDRPMTRAGRRLEIIEFVFGGPEIPGTLGAKAAEILDKILRGVGKVRHLDLALLSGLLTGGPNSNSRGDLVSYLLFEPEFMRAAIELGQKDGQAILRKPPLWKDVYFPFDAAVQGRSRGGRSTKASP